MISSTAAPPHLHGPHLTDEQLADLLADVCPATDATAHLASCTLCPPRGAATGGNQRVGVPQRARNGRGHGVRF